MLKLDDLPEPLTGKTGWPWTTPISTLNGADWPLDQEYPKISIVTPSYNQAAFLEETIRSVLLQGYPNLEFLLLDGGSSDRSIEIIKKYQPYFAFWRSEKDRGQSHALNTGFCQATGDLMGWQNSDDFYHSEAFFQVAKAALDYPEVDVFYGNTVYVNEESQPYQDYGASEFDFCRLFPYLNFSTQSLFFRRRIIEAGELLDENLDHAMDLDFFVRLAVKGYKFKFIPGIKGYFRSHSQAKGSTQERVFARESFAVYRSVYHNKNLLPAFREKAFSSMHSACLESFRQNDLEFFRTCFYDLLQAKPSQVRDIKLMIKYGLSFLGKDLLTKLHHLRHPAKTNASHPHNGEPMQTPDDSI